MFFYYSNAWTQHSVYWSARFSQPDMTGVEDHVVFGSMKLNIKLTSDSTEGWTDIFIPLLEVFTYMRLQCCCCCCCLWIMDKTIEADLSEWKTLYWGSRYVWRDWSLRTTQSYIFCLGRQWEPEGVSNSVSTVGLIWSYLSWQKATVLAERFPAKAGNV